MSDEIHCLYSFKFSCDFLFVSSFTLSWDKLKLVIMDLSLSLLTLCFGFFVYVHSL